MIPNFTWVEPGKLAGMADPRGASQGEDVLAALAGKGVTGVVSATEEELPAEWLAAAEIEYLHLPMQDMSAPSMAALDAFVEFVRRVNSRGGAVAVHCGAGLGRTGTMLAAYLVTKGCRPWEAVAAVRRLRPGSIETAEQEKALYAFARRQAR